MAENRGTKYRLIGSSNQYHQIWWGMKDRDWRSRTSKFDGNVDKCIERNAVYTLGCTWYRRRVQLQQGIIRVMGRARNSYGATVGKNILPLAHSMIYETVQPRWNVNRTFLAKDGVWVKNKREWRDRIQSTIFFFICYENRYRNEFQLFKIIYYIIIVNTTCSSTGKRIDFIPCSTLSRYEFPASIFIC